MIELNQTTLKIFNKVILKFSMSGSKKFTSYDSVIIFNGKYNRKFSYFMFIDPNLLSSDALHGLIKEYLYRSDFDSSASSDEALQIKQMVQALKNGELVITWSEVHESFNIQTKQSFEQCADEFVDSEYDY